MNFFFFIQIFFFFFLLLVASIIELFWLMPRIRLSDLELRGEEQDQGMIGDGATLPGESSSFQRSRRPTLSDAVAKTVVSCD